MIETDIKPENTTGHVAVVH